MSWPEFCREFWAAHPLAKLHFELCVPPGFFLGVGELRLVRVQPVAGQDETVWHCLVGYQTYQKIAKVKPPKVAAPAAAPAPESPVS